MELDILNKSNLDDSIINDNYSGFNAINVPIKRGMFVNQKSVISPFYQYENSNFSGFIKGTRVATSIAPKTSIGLSAIPIASPTTTLSGGISLDSPTLSTPTLSTGISFGNPSPSSLGQSAPTLSTPFSPINPMQGGATQLNNPAPLVSTTPTNTPTNTPSPMNTMSMGGGGGGGGVASPSSEEATNEQAAVSSGMRVADINKKSMSKEAKIGLLILLAIGGYYAYKKGVFGKV
jgi:hypothetical protein